MWPLLDRPLPADLLRRAVVLVWTNLPLLLVVGTGSALLWSTFRSSAAALLIAYLVVVPMLTVLAGGFVRLMRGDGFGVRQYVRAFPRGMIATWATLLPAAAGAGLAVVADTLWADTGQTWMLLSIGAAATFTFVVAVLGLVAAVIVTADGVPVAAACAGALAAVARQPIPVIGVGASFLLSAWATRYLSLAPMVLLPAVIAPIWAMAVREAGESDGFTRSEHG